MLCQDKEIIPIYTYTCMSWSLLDKSVNSTTIFKMMDVYLSLLPYYYRHRMSTPLFDGKVSNRKRIVSQTQLSLTTTTSLENVSQAFNDDDQDHLYDY